MLHERVPLLLADARAAADFVVIDTPPLGEFSDALRIAQEVDEVIVVARPRHTDRRHFEVMRDLLNRTGHVPVGMLVVGGSQAPRSGSYGRNDRPETSQRRFARFRR
jgi:Mrp family chromosome partitioning ATPase